MHKMSCAILFLLFACSADDGQVSLRVGTDFLSSREFDTVRVTETSGRQIDIAVGVDDWSEPRFVANFSAGAQVTIAVLSRGRVLVRRKLVVNSVTDAYLHRACTAVSCEEGDACVAGKCEPESCTSGAETSCGMAECAGDSECENQNCLNRKCVNARCVGLASDSLCTLGETCDLFGLCTTPTGPTCNDGKQNGSETDIDCGGACPKCDVGKICGAGNDDCLSGLCVDSICTTARCSDNMFNGDETDIDCGGSCQPCEDGAACVKAVDCKSQKCGVRCLAPSCDDGIKNGGEADVDCGGECSRCAIGKSCSETIDCITLRCSDGICASTCEDNIKNGTETDIDCGGKCYNCPNGKSCNVNADCFGICGQDQFCTSCTLNAQCESRQICEQGDCVVD